MSKENMKKLSNAVFIAAMGFAGIVLVIIGMDYLPALSQGACPFSRHKGLAYASLAVLLASVVITSILDAKAKRMAPESETTPLKSEESEKKKE